MVTKKILNMLLTTSLFILFLFTPSYAEALNPIPAGIGPYAVLANPTAHEVYVANMWSDEITVIDSLTDTVITTINVQYGSLSSPVSLALNPNTNRLYVLNFYSATLMVVDLNNNYQIEATIPVSYSHSAPRAVVVNPITNLVYVTTLGQNPVGVIEGNPASPNFNQIIATVPVGLYARSAAIDTNNDQLFVVNTNSNNVSVIDVDPASPDFHQVVETVTAGTEPFAVGVNNSTGKVYVTNMASNNVTVINSATNSVIKTVSTGTSPSSLDINTERNQIFVANEGSANVTVIDGSDDSVTATVPVGARPRAVASIKTLTGNTFVTNHDSGTVTVIDPSLSTTTETVGTYPFALSIDTLLAKPQVYVGNYGTNDVSVIDPPVGSSSLVTDITAFPGDQTTDTTPVFMGTSTSTSTPYPSKIIQVYYLIDTLDSRWKEAQITAGWGTSSVNWQVNEANSLSLGLHSINVVALDINGATISSTNGNVNTSPLAGTVASYSFEVIPEVTDDIPPETNISFSGTQGLNNWYTSDITATLDATDDSSGVETTEYSFDGNNWNIYTNPFTIANEGETAIYYRSTDIAGNVELTKTATVKIDKTPPIITGSPTTSPNANNWYNTNVIISFTATDGHSGIDFVTPDITVYAEGENQSVLGTATDLAGNNSNYIVEGINIDKTAPSVSGSIPQNSYLYNYPFEVAYTVSDDLSGIDLEGAYLNDTLILPGVVSLTNLGNNTLEYTAIDLAGNEATQAFTFDVTYKVDWQPPLKFLDDLGIYGATIGEDSVLLIKWITRDYFGNIIEDNTLTFMIYDKSNPTNLQIFNQGNNKDQIKYDPATGQYSIMLRTKDISWIVPSTGYEYALEIWGGTIDNSYLGNLLDPAYLQVVKKGKK